MVNTLEIYKMQMVFVVLGDYGVFIFYISNGRR